MNLPTLPVQHLSDEAVAAFADGALGATARSRAARHVAECSECANAVAVQREAVLALRAATVPSLPGGLLDRLRAVPTTTPLTQRPLALDPDGSAVFAAFGTETAAPAKPEPQILPTQAPMSAVRRHRPYGLLTAAAAVVALGAAGVALAGSGTDGAGSGTTTVPAPGAPAAGTSVRPAVLDPGAGPFFRPAAISAIDAVRADR